ncbi:transmembrane protein 41B isoform X1 [Tribolium madens]|uniref:transmembrane protein 41B isoform X1 n=1 Tax=Tribolium madens TaxID=41895 RepID=UPI001CF72194|nr:transmembrane protein 41B isoform X1 [Tribolium madens]
MTTQQNIQGDNQIQCFQISSTSDIYNRPFLSNYQIRGRPTYRRSINFTNHSPVMIPNRQSIHDPNNSISTRTALVSVFIIFLSSLFALFLVYKTFPQVTEEERQHIKLPWNIEDAKQLGIVLNRYKADHYFQVMTGVFTAYIFLQTFAIPGSLFLSVLSGFLFPFTVALTLVCTCSAVGASLCFLLSQLLGRKLVLKYFPEKAAAWGHQVNKHRDNLFNYVLFLRITPFLPNWFINLTAPVIGVPLVPFALGTFFGVAPPSFIAIQGGQTLQNMTADDFKISASSLVTLAVCGIIPLLPIIFKGWLKKKIE